MLNIIDHRMMGKSDQGWLHSTFHFSFAEYYNPNNINYGALRVINDDIFDPGNGFATHPHRDMEIVSYVVNGVLTHRDNMGNARELTRGQVQYMSAGTGVTHSEYNLTKDPLRFLQIWILPDKNAHLPNYGDYRFEWEDRRNKWLPIISGTNGNAPIIIHQDMDIAVLYLDAGNELQYSLKDGRQAYIVQIEGEGFLNGQLLKAKDGAQLYQEDITLCAKSDAHYILFDMQAEQN